VVPQRFNWDKFIIEIKCTLGEQKFPSVKADSITRKAVVLAVFVRFLKAILNADFEAVQKLFLKLFKY
jgi:hypothetical protein